MSAAIDESAFRDARLHDSWRRGDLEAGAELVVRYRRRLIAFGPRLGLAQLQCQDLAQDVLLVAANLDFQARAGATYWGWLSALARKEASRIHRDSAEHSGAAFDLHRYRRWLTGDTDAGAELVREHHADLVSWIARRVGSPHVAHDIAQDVWLQAMRGSYAGRSSLRRWLLIVAKSGVCRYHSRRPRFTSFTPAARTSPTQDLLRHEIAEALLEISNSDQRSACRRWYFEGSSVEQIAASTGTKPKTVWSRIRLATTKLQSRLAFGP